MTHSFPLAASDSLSWPVIGLILVASAAWDCYTGEVRFGQYFEFDKYDSVGPYVILVGLKFVAAILIFITIYSGVS